MQLSEAYPSNYLKATDLQGRDVVVTIESVSLEEIGQGADKEKKLVISFKGKEKSLVCNRTNAQTIAQVTGESDTDDWPGHSIILTSRDVDFQGRTILAIRVSLKKPTTAAPKPKAPPVEQPPGAGDDLNESEIPF